MTDLLRAASERAYFVVGVYDDHASPVHLDPYTLADAKRSKAWQGVGGPTPMHICTPHEGRLTMVDIDNGELLKVDVGGWTQDAWNQFVDRIWPHGDLR